MNAYHNATIYAHLAMSAEQACNFAREHGMLLVHTKRGNYIFSGAPQEAGSVTTSSGTSLPLKTPAAVAGTLEGA